MLELPSDWNVPPDDEVEEAIAAHHGEIMARQIAKFTPEALPWIPEDDTTDFVEAFVRRMSY